MGRDNLEMTCCCEGKSDQSNESNPCRVFMLWVRVRTRLWRFDVDSYKKAKCELLAAQTEQTSGNCHKHQHRHKTNKDDNSNSSSKLNRQNLSLASESRLTTHGFRQQQVWGAIHVGMISVQTQTVEPCLLCVCKSVCVCLGFSNGQCLSLPA